MKFEKYIYWGTIEYRFNGKQFQLSFAKNTKTGELVGLFPRKIKRFSNTPRIKFPAATEDDLERIVKAI